MKPMPFRPVGPLAREPLVRQRREEAGLEATPSGLWTPEYLETELGAGRLELSVWKATGEAEQGLVVWQRLGPSRSRVLSFWLGPSARTEETVTRLLVELVGPDALPGCTILPDRTTGVPSEVLDRALRPRGFRHIPRVRLRAPLREYPTVPPPAGVTLRPADPEDLEELVDLFRRAYGRDADTLFGPNVDPERDSREYLTEEIFRKPSWDRKASFFAISSRRIVGSVLTQRNPDGFPLIADLMVDPRFRRLGIGSTLLSACAAALRDQGETSAELTVTLSNPNRAYEFYARRGFVLVPDELRRPGGIWARQEFLRERKIELLPDSGAPAFR